MSVLNRIKEMQEAHRKTEHCVVCGVDTKVPVTMHVDLRFFYVEGAGQLCKECYNRAYQSDTKNPWVCGICGKDTSMVEYDYLMGTDHLGCVLEKEMKK